MQRFFRAKHRNAIVTVCAAGVLLGLAGVRAQADQWDKKTYFTIDQPVQVRETVLQPGKYVFKLLDSQSDRHIVQIFNSDQTHLINTVLAIPNYRLQPTGKSQFAFWETPPGSAHALRAWFYPGDNFGQEFAYPKHLAMLQTTSVTETHAAPQAEAPAPAPAPEPEAKSEPAPEQPAPVTTQPEPQPEQQPTQMAQNNPPPAPEVAQSTPPTPAPDQSSSSRLPSTASPYTLLGLAGFTSLMLYGLLKVARLA